MMDVTVESSPIGVARVTIDLGDGHKLYVRASHDTDTYRNVVVQWSVPAHKTGPVEQVRDRKTRQWRHRLNLRTGKVE